MRYPLRLFSSLYAPSGDNWLLQYTGCLLPFKHHYVSFHYICILTVYIVFILYLFFQLYPYCLSVCICIIGSAASLLPCQFKLPIGTSGLPSGDSLGTISAGFTALPPGLYLACTLPHVPPLHCGTLGVPCVRHPIRLVSRSRLDAAYPVCTLP